METTESSQVKSWLFWRISKSSHRNIQVTYSLVGPTMLENRVNVCVRTLSGFKCYELSPPFSKKGELLSFSHQYLNRLCNYYFHINHSGQSSLFLIVPRKLLSINNSRTKLFLSIFTPHFCGPFSVFPYSLSSKNTINPQVDNFLI